MKTSYSKTQWISVRNIEATIDIYIYINRERERGGGGRGGEG
jgi:hypothetical protein